MFARTVWLQNHDNKIVTIGFVFALLMCFTLPTGISIPTIFGAMILLLGLVLYAGKGMISFDILKHPLVLPVGFFILLPWAGLAYSRDSLAMGLDYAGKTHYWLYGFAIMAMGFHWKRCEYLILAFLAGLGLNAVVGLMQFAHLVPLNNGTFSGLIRQYSTLSAYLIIGMLTASLYFRKTDDFQKKIWILGFICLLFLHLSILKSRTGYITFALLSPFLVHNLFKKLNVWKTAIACFLLFFMMFLSPVVRARVMLSVDQLRHHMNADPEAAWGKTYSAKQDRFYMWYQGVRIVMKNPLTGVGTGGFQQALDQLSHSRAPLIAHPHNDFLYMTVSYGIFGIFAFFLFFGYIIRFSWTRRHLIPGGFVFYTVLAILVSGLFNAQILDAGMAFILSIAVGILFILTRETGFSPEMKTK